MVHDMKEAAPKSSNMISYLPELLEQIIINRNTDLRKKQEVLDHNLKEASDEILAPCMFEPNTHLGDNWAEFRRRWSRQYAAYWQCKRYAGKVAYKFLVGPDRPPRSSSRRAITF